MQRSLTKCVNGVFLFLLGKCKEKWIWIKVEGEAKRSFGRNRIKLLIWCFFFSSTHHQPWQRVDGPCRVWRWPLEASKLAQGHSGCVVVLQSTETRRLRGGTRRLKHNQIDSLSYFFLFVVVVLSDTKERTNEEEEEKHGWGIHPPKKFESFCQTWTSGDWWPHRWQLIALAGYTTGPSAWRWIWLARLALADKMVQGWQNLSDPFSANREDCTYFFFKLSGNHLRLFAKTTTAVDRRLIFRIFFKVLVASEGQGCNCNGTHKHLHGIEVEKISHALIWLSFFKSIGGSDFVPSRPDW